jgi:hypothetical protein
MRRWLIYLRLDRWIEEEVDREDGEKWMYIKVEREKK